MSSTCCFGPLFRKTTWVGSGFSDGSRLETRDISGSCCVTSPGSRVGITVDTAGSAMLRLWHGLGLLQMVGFKASVQRTGFQVNLARVGGRSKRVQEHKKRESACWRVILNSLIWTPPTGGWSNQSVCIGRSPTHVHGFYPLYTFSCDEKLTFTHVLKLLLGLHIYNITTFVILLIHTFLHPFIQV